MSSVSQLHAHRYLLVVTETDAAGTTITVSRSSAKSRILVSVDEGRHPVGFEGTIEQTELLIAALKSAITQAKAAASSSPQGLAKKAQRQEKRANLQDAAARLRAEGIPYQTTNGVHFMVNGGQQLGRIDFWPSTGKWHHLRGSRWGLGLDSLVDFVKGPPPSLTAIHEGACG